MTDRRLHPANTHVAASELAGKSDAPRYADGEWHRVVRPVVDILRIPGGARDRQLLFGERVRVLEFRDGHAFAQSGRDGYVGYIPEGALGMDSLPTHRVVAPSTHFYPEPDLKMHEIDWLSFGSPLTVQREVNGFAELADGVYVPAGHVAPVSENLTDPVAVAELFLGAPYLWGGNSRMGIDCSGLVQAALHACGVDCPGDSDMQQDALGTEQPDGAPVERGDLFFWKGHVGIAADAETLLHATAHYMSVVREPLSAAIARIAASDTGPVTAHKRL